MSPPIHAGAGLLASGGPSRRYCRRGGAGDDQNDGRGGGGRDAASTWGGHDLRPAWRAERRALRRLLRRRRGLADHSYPARAGCRLHGVRLCPVERQGRDLRGGAGPGVFEYDRGARHRVRHQCPGFVPQRPGAVRSDRPRLRPPARDPRSAWHSLPADKMGGARRPSRPASGRSSTRLFASCTRAALARSGSKSHPMCWRWRPR